MVAGPLHVFGGIKRVLQEGLYWIVFDALSFGRTYSYLINKEYPGDANEAQDENILYHISQ